MISFRRDARGPCVPLFTRLSAFLFFHLYLYNSEVCEAGCEKATSATLRES